MKINLYLNSFESLEVLYDSFIFPPKTEKILEESEENGNIPEKDQEEIKEINLFIEGSHPDLSLPAALEFFKHLKLIKANGDLGKTIFNTIATNRLTIPEIIIWLSGNYRFMHSEAILDCELYTTEELNFSLEAGHDLFQSIKDIETDLKNLITESIQKQLMPLSEILSEIPDIKISEIEKIITQNEKKKKYKKPKVKFSAHSKNEINQTKILHYLFNAQKISYEDAITFGIASGVFKH